MMQSKNSRPWLLWEGILCLLLCCFIFLLMVPFSSNSATTQWVFRALPVSAFLIPPMLTALALGLVLLLGAGRVEASAPARLLQRVFAILCLCGALVLLLQFLNYKRLFQSMSSPWPLLPIPNLHPLMTGTLPQFLWLLAALSAIVWMTFMRPRLTQVGRVFWWGLLIGGGLYCIIGIATAIVPLLTASGDMAAKIAAIRGTNRMRAMSGAWLAPLAFLLFFGYPSEKAAPAFAVPRGFYVWSIIVAIANAGTLLLLGWTTEFTGLATMLLVMGVFLSYCLLLTGQKKGFWLLVVLSIATAAMNFLLTGPTGLIGLLNPLVCWLLLRNSWSVLW